MAPLAGGLVSPSQCLGTPAGGQEAGEGPLTSGGLFKITITSEIWISVSDFELEIPCTKSTKGEGDF